MTKKSEPLSTDERLAAVARLAGSMTLEEIAAQLGVSEVTTYNDLRSLRLSAKKPAKVLLKTKRFQERLAKVALLASSMTVKEMAERFGVSKITISNDLRRLGLSAKKTPKVKRKVKVNPEVEQRRAKVARWADSMTVPEMASRFGVSVATVYSDLRILASGVSSVTQRRDEVARLAPFMTVTEMADRLNATDGTIRNDLKSLGLTWKAHSKLQSKTKERLAEVMRMASSMTVKEMAAQLGVRTYTIERDLKRLGLVSK